MKTGTRIFAGVVSAAAVALMAGCGQQVESNNYNLPDPDSAHNIAL